MKLFINNEWHRSRTGNTFDTVNPADGRILAQIQAAGKPDVDAAVAAARKAFR